MLTQTVTITQNSNPNIIIGRRSTHETQQVIFDVSWLVQTYGEGTAELLIKRPKDASAYPVVAVLDGNTLTWTVSETDTQDKGHGECEIYWYVNGGLAKSCICGITILRDIGDTTETAPDPYETWVDELARLGAETLTNAQAAEQSAEDAAQSAQEAAESAASVEGAVEQAEAARDAARAAQTASEAARDAAQTAQASAESSATAASGSAASAAGSATAAAGSASDASSSASAAGASATTASTAAGQAEAAKTAAQTAQSAAEDAQAAAEQAAQQAHVEYEQLSGEVDDLSDEVSQQKSAIEDLQDLTNRKAGMLVDSASGAIASFVPDSTIENLLGLTVDIEPVQDLHGYDNPWPAGGGKNIYDFDGVLESSGATYTKSGNVYTITANAALFTRPFKFSDTDIEVTLSYTDFGDVTSTHIRFDILDANGALVTAIGKNSSPATVTGSKIRFDWSTSGQFTVGNVQIEKGSSATAWTPYSNICPISGQDSVEVEAAGKNLFDESQKSMLACYADDGAAQTRRGVKLWLPAGTYTIKATRAAEGNGFIYCNIVNKDGSYAEFRYFIAGVGSTLPVTRTFTLTEGQSFILFDQQASAESSVDKMAYYHYMIVSGSTGADYEPYVGTTHTIQLGDTVYGGTLDVTTGKLTVTYAEYVFTGNEAWQASSTPNRFFVNNMNQYLPYNMAAQPMVANAKQNVISSIFGTFAYKNADGVGYIVTGSNELKQLVVNTTAATTVADINTIMTGSQLAYELETPIVIDLDPVTIATIANQTNNVWADAGDVNVEFAADLKAYIDSKIAAAVAAMS